MKSPLRTDELLIRPLFKSDHLGWSNFRPKRMQRNRTRNVLIGRELGWTGTSVVIAKWAGWTRDLIRRWSELRSPWRKVMEREWRPDQRCCEMSGELSKVIELGWKPDQKWANVSGDLIKVDRTRVQNWSEVIGHK